MSDNSTKANLLAKILFIAGGIILFIVLVIFIFRIVPIAISNLSNFGGNIFSGLSKKSTNEAITVSTDSDVINVKNPVVVSFVYESKDQQLGQYFVSYDCIDGLFFDIQSKEGPKRLICDTPLRLGANISSISLTPLFTKSNGFADSLITISYKDEKGNTLDFGTKTITIKGEETAASTEENPYTVDNSLSGSTVTTKEVASTTNNVPPTKTTTSTYTNPTKDLTVAYIARTNNDSSFVMHVYNYGNISTGPWEFSYTDAENPSRIVTSPIQAPLKGGQGLAVTVNFDSQYNSSQTIVVAIDPYNKIQETNEINNTSSIVIFGDESNFSNNNYNSNDDADLIITNIKVGRISGNRFVQDDEINEDDTAAILFVVKNNGGEFRDSWRFEITNLPYDNDDTYRSKTYSSLRPGETMQIVTEFDGINDGRYSIKVKVDSDDDVNEERENNNIESETLEVTR